jgi:trk system potassium uptake protein TrkH
MNKRMMLYVCGFMLAVEAGLMLLPIVTALIYREPTGWAFCGPAWGPAWPVWLP